MSKTTSEQVASYIYDRTVTYGIYNVFACYASIEDYDKRNVDFYDVYEDSGLCVNEGEPYYTMPTWEDVYQHYYLPSVLEAKKEHPRDLQAARNNV